MLAELKRMPGGLVKALKQRINQPFHELELTPRLSLVSHTLLASAW